VESSRASLMRKLNLRNQTDLVRYALRRGILPLGEERFDGDGLRTRTESPRLRTRTASQPETKVCNMT